MGTVYPRWRGEHFYAIPGANYFVGLSPLARGTPIHGDSLAGLHRFIPAGAGNTAPPVHHLQMQPVYPRWRGEHWRSSRQPNSFSGLSPLARGTQTNCSADMSR